MEAKEGLETWEDHAAVGEGVEDDVEGLETVVSDESAGIEGWWRSGLWSSGWMQVVVVLELWLALAAAVLVVMVWSLTESMSDDRRQLLRR